MPDAPNSKKNNDDTTSAENSDVSSDESSVSDTDVASGASGNSTVAPNGTVATEQAAQEAFTAHYMATLATEFAEDLDKIRSARDFKGEASLEILLDALRQGTTSYSADERARIGREVLAGA